MEITNFIKQIQPSQERIKELNEIPKFFEKHLQKQFPDCKIHAFGSCVTGLYTLSSDVDMFMEHNYKTTHLSSHGLSKKEEIIRGQIIEELHFNLRNVKGISGLLFLPKAKTPVIKFTYDQIRCDFTVKSILAVFDSKLVKYFLNLNPKIMQTMILVKYIIYERFQFNCTKFSKYGVTLMFLFYLQQPNVQLVPPINKLKDNCHEAYAEGWQVNFDQNYSHGWFSLRNIYVTELLHGFFHYYSKFDFKNKVVCPFDGKVYDRAMFYGWETPASMEKYSEAMKKKPFKPDCPMWIQDMTELNNNVGSSVKNEVLTNFKSLCCEMKNICCDISDSDLIDILQSPRFQIIIESAHFQPSTSADDDDDDDDDRHDDDDNDDYHHHFYDGDDVAEYRPYPRYNVHVARFNDDDDDDPAWNRPCTRYNASTSQPQNPVNQNASDESSFMGLGTFGTIVFGASAVAALGYGISKLMEDDDKNKKKSNTAPRTYNSP